MLDVVQKYSYSCTSDDINVCSKRVIGSVFVN